MSFRDIPEHLIIDIINGLNIKDVERICSVDKRINKFCNEDKKTKFRLIAYKITNLDIKNLTQKEKCVALYKASATSNFELIDYLLTNQSCLDAAVISAAENDKLETIKYLESKGANLDEPNEFALLAAVEKGNYDIVEYLVENSSSEIPQEKLNEALLKAVYFDHLSVVKYLSNFADISFHDDLPLKTSAARGHLAVVKYLVSRGANINNGLVLAASNGRFDIVKYLISTGFGSTPGVSEATPGVRRILGVRRTHGTNPQIELDKAIILSTEKGYLDIAKYLKLYKS